MARVSQNVNEVPDHIRTVEEPLDQRMAAYDSLPRRLREMIDDAPLPQSPTEVYRVWLKYNMDTEFVARGFVLGWQQAFPGYRPPRRRPPRPLRVNPAP